MAIPEKLEDAVDWSAFEVRACTHREVGFTRQYLLTVDPRTLSHLVRGPVDDPEKTRQNLLRFLLEATSSWGTTDHAGKAQIEPEN